MKRFMIAILIAVVGSWTSASAANSIYMQVTPIISGGEVVGGSTAASGCYLSPGQECRGVFSLDDNGLRSRVGSITTDVRPAPGLEIVYGITWQTESDRAQFVGTVYTMQIDSEGTILRGHKTEIRHNLPDNDEIVMAQPVGTTSDGKTIALQISANRKGEQHLSKTYGHLITLISTQLGAGEDEKSLVNWYNQPDGTYRFRSNFKSEHGDTCNVLMYDVEVKIDYGADLAHLSSLDASTLPVSGRLHFNRKYMVHTQSCKGQSFSANASYVSGYEKEVTFRPGETLKLVFPPDSPSVRGFAIEDTLVIFPR
jgi:hypothetical protein